MNLEKFTDRAKGFLQSAQTVAVRMSHQRITPVHILKALLEDEEGMAAQLIQRAGGSPPAAIGEGHGLQYALYRNEAAAGLLCQLFGLIEQASRIIVEGGRRLRS